MEKEIHIVMAVDISEGSNYLPYCWAIEDNHDRALSKAKSYLHRTAKEWNLDPVKVCDYDNLRVANEEGTKGLQLRIHTAAVKIAVRVVE